MPSDASTQGLTAWADIDLGAISDNVARLSRLAGDADVMAVIKGDAYGHGLVPVAHAALADGATYLAIAQLSEAVAARAADVTAPVLTWLFPPGRSGRSDPCRPDPLRGRPVDAGRDRRSGA